MYGPARIALLFGMRSQPGSAKSTKGSALSGGPKNCGAILESLPLSMLDINESGLISSLSVGAQTLRMSGMPTTQRRVPRREVVGYLHILTQVPRDSFSLRTQECAPPRSVETCSEGHLSLCILRMSVTHRQFQICPCLVYRIRRGSIYRTLCG